MLQRGDESYSDNQITYTYKLACGYHAVYITCILIIIICLVCLPFIKLDITVRAKGMIRPVLERTALQSQVSGSILSVDVREGETVKENDLIIQLDDSIIRSSKNQLEIELGQQQIYISDLRNLTRMGADGTITNRLKSPLYRQEFNRFNSQHQELSIKLKQTDFELDIASRLAKDKVIAPKEFFDKQIDREKSLSSIQSLQLHQQAIWEQNLQEAEQRLRSIQSEYRKAETNLRLYQVRSPLRGSIQFISNRYPGLNISAGETICVISPDTRLIAECIVSASDIGYLTINQPCIVQLDAFDYNQFGVITGNVESIDPDNSVENNQIFYKVRCTLDRTTLSLPNGFKGSIQKGMSFTARFFITKRSLWQLMYDQIDDWLNPAAPIN